MRRKIGRLLRWTERFLSKRLNALSRLWILASTACIAASFLFPLYHIHLEAPQYREGLDLWIYSYKIEAGNEGQDLNEINILNHYIGMQEVHEANFMEMKLIPFALGVFIILGMRAVVFGTVRNLIDHMMVYVYFCMFAFGVFMFRMYSYGHDLDPKAPLNPDPFWPSLFGTKQIANMTQTSLPHIASYLLIAAFLCLLMAIFHSRREPPFFTSNEETPAGGRQ